MFGYLSLVVIVLVPMAAGWAAALTALNEESLADPLETWDNGKVW